MIRLEQLRFRYPHATRDAFEPVELEVQAGEAVTFVGASGSGKTTLLRILAGIAPALTGGTAHGSGRIAGRAFPHEHDLADLVALLPQDPANATVCDRVEDELAFTAENLGIASARIARRVDEQLDRFGIEPLRRRRITTLSGGERQRVQLAAALVAEPRVLLLDEPTSQLDTDAIDALGQTLRRLRGETTILLVEQRPDRLEPFADRRIRLGDARTGSPDQPRAPLARRTPGDVQLAAHDIGIERDGTPILREVSIEVRAGEVVALTGGNGAGKTTLLRALLGMQPIASGRIQAPDARSLAYLPQRPETAFCRDRVRDEIALTMRARRIRDDLEATIERLGIADLADCSPRRLSAGERLRAAIAALTVGAPRAILLDEPTRGLDPAARAHLHTRLDAWRADGVAVLLATHDDDLVAGCDRRVTLERGRVAGTAIGSATIGATTIGATR